MMKPRHEHKGRATRYRAENKNSSGRPLEPELRKPCDPPPSPALTIPHQPPSMQLKPAFSGYESLGPAGLHLEIGLAEVLPCLYPPSLPPPDVGLLCKSTCGPDPAWLLHSLNTLASEAGLDVTGKWVQSIARRWELRCGPVGSCMNSSSPFT